MTSVKKGIFTSLALIVLILWIVSIWWGFPPAAYDVKTKALETAKINNHKIVPGYTITTTLIDVTSWLIEKPGGFFSNDVTPPGLFMDNVPAFEYGALKQIRDLSLAMRLNFSRSPSQTTGDNDLEKAQEKINTSHKNWALPSAEKEYRQAIASLVRYRTRLVKNSQNEAQFYTRADNLSAWLSAVEKRLGSLSQRLSSSVGQDSYNIVLAGDSSTKQSTETAQQMQIKTPWFQIDDVFYESRGATWAILHFLKAIEVDFTDVLEKKNAQVSLNKIIKDLESTQAVVWSPVILNGSGFGLLANHSSVMASYVSRANVALIDLRRLLEQG
ncbi:conserved hypothetical protein [Psychromonas ingrahamii 37]|uniref:DUF2333 family protein n=1 Tax=Psychromonas ingrahamii (strain DSM 17664 / CCUG 51855 / 37) TaxID=357804 RepID=A1STR8_PSYIN|nr:DUF2333 family protein [Psychromonas ingrahamii]ABM02883.1 conserved hypothetical protein [Psychromonas ingrahamii 37]